MVKAIINGKKGKTLFIGLSFANLSMLKLGKPIFFEGSEVGLHENFLIYAAETEQVIAEDLRKFVEGEDE